MPEYVSALDVSSYQSPSYTAGLISQLQPDHVITRLYLPDEAPDQQVSRELVRVVRDSGKTVGGYFWCYRSADPMISLLQVLELCASIGLVLPILWADCETYRSPSFNDDGPDAEWLSRLFEAGDALQTPIGIYTGEWWVQGVFPGGYAAYEPFVNRPHWISRYDAEPSMAPPWSAWVSRLQLAGKQWSGDPVDRSTFIRGYTELNQPVEEPPEVVPVPVDPCASERAKLARFAELLDVKPYKAPSRRMVKEILGVV